MSMFPSKRTASRHLERCRDDLWQVADRSIVTAEAHRTGQFQSASIRAFKSLQSMPDTTIEPVGKDERELRDFYLHSREANQLDTLGSICDALLSFLRGSLEPEDLARRLEAAAAHVRDGSAPDRG